MYAGPPEAESFELDLAAACDRGSRRVPNHVGVQHRDGPTRGMIAVADGFAPSEGAALASRRAVQALLRTYRALPAGTSLTQRMVRAAREACFDVYGLATVVPQLRGAGCTLTAVAVAGEQMTAAHVGNGRVYLVRDGGITQLSKDHTVAAEAEAEGRCYVGDDGNALTRCLGRALLVPIDVFEMGLRRGDVIVACTAGLSTVLSEERIADGAAAGDATGACGELIAEAVARAGSAGLAVGILRWPEAAKIP